MIRHFAYVARSMRQGGRGLKVYFVHPYAETGLGSGSVRLRRHLTHTALSISQVTAAAFRSLSPKSHGGCFTRGLFRDATGEGKGGGGAVHLRRSTAYGGFLCVRACVLRMRVCEV